MSFVARNHPQQVGARGALPHVDDRQAPPELFDPLHERFGFTVDAAATPLNAQLPRYWTIEDDGLKQDWSFEVVWCNPPYSNIRPWVEKAWATPESWRRIVMLLPANRTEQGWWQDLVEPYRDTEDLRVEFLRGRRRFIQAGVSAIGPNERPPFGLCLLLWGFS